MKPLFDQLSVLGLKGSSALITRLPSSWTQNLGRSIGKAAYCFVSRRKQAYADIRNALPEIKTPQERWQIIRKLFEHFGQMAVETLRGGHLPDAYFEEHIQVHQLEVFHRAFEKNKGVIFLTAHLGNWELLQFYSGHHGKPIHVLAQEQKHSKLNDFLTHLRQSRGKTIAVSTGMGGLRDFVRALRQNGALGLLGDRAAGKHEGIILPFFEKKTTVPTGAFDLAWRTEAELVPCFMLRGTEREYDLFFETPIEMDRTLPQEEAVKKAAEQYLRILENYIRRYPDQWHWFTKRWKYSWTKRLLILSDGKPGHVKQSEAIAYYFSQVREQYGRPGMEYPTETIRVEFQSTAHRLLFYWAAPFLIPWAQGRMSWLKFFLTPACYEKINQARFDFVISAGTSLVPLNLFLCRESLAKTVVLMKPSFPYLFYPYDLAFIPAHDQGLVPKKNFRTMVTPNVSQKEKLQADAQKLSSSLRNPSQLKMAVFLGGNTRKFQMSLSGLETFFSELKKQAKKIGDYAVTTSRRTPDSVTEHLYYMTLHDASCQLFVNAKKDARSEVVGGMMQLADILIVTEDSLSMISEAVSTGKSVLVLTFGSEGLPAKHIRFQKLLKDRGLIQTVTPGQIASALSHLSSDQAKKMLEKEKKDIQKELQAIL